MLADAVDDSVYEIINLLLIFLHFFPLVGRQNGVDFAVEFEAFHRKIRLSRRHFRRGGPDGRLGCVGGLDRRAQPHPSLMQLGNLALESVLIRFELSLDLFDLLVGHAELFLDPFQNALSNSLARRGALGATRYGHVYPAGSKTGGHCHYQPFRSFHTAFSYAAKPGKVTTQDYRSRKVPHHRGTPRPIPPRHSLNTEPEPRFTFHVLRFTPPLRPHLTI